MEREKYILLCKTEWLACYENINEQPPKKTDGKQLPFLGESMNFHPTDGMFYGYVANKGNSNGGQSRQKKIAIEKRFGVDKKADKAKNILVVFCATDPESSRQLVTGWYRHADVYRKSFKRPRSESVKEKLPKISVYFTSNEAHLVPEELRKHRIPTSSEKPGFPTVVRFGYGFGLNEPKAKEFADKLREYIDREVKNKTEKLPDPDLPYSGKEGAPKLRKHLMRERDQKIVKWKKADVLREKGCLKCEVCDFDFEETYGRRGKDFCEVHHLTPLSHLDGEVETKLEDLAIICSNCHRIIHHGSPLLSLEDLRTVLENAEE